MEKSSLSIHPELLDGLFRHKTEQRHIFLDVLGLHDIDELHVHLLSNQRELFIISSMPAIPYTLFSNSLWHYDDIYSQELWQQASTSLTPSQKILNLGAWEQFYSPLRFDELYYLKHKKNRLNSSDAFFIRIENALLLLTIGSQQKNMNLHWDNEFDSIVDIANYCYTRLIQTLPENFLSQGETHEITA